MDSFTAKKSIRQKWQTLLFKKKDPNQKAMCVYCQVPIQDYFFETKKYSIEIDYSKGLWVRKNTDILEYIKFNYCPKCGREL